MELEPAGKPQVSEKVAEVLDLVEKEKVTAKGNKQWLDALDRVASDVQSGHLTPLRAKQALNNIAIRFEELPEERKDGKNYPVKGEDFIKYGYGNGTKKENRTKGYKKEKP